MKTYTRFYTTTYFCDEARAWIRAYSGPSRADALAAALKAKADSGDVRVHRLDNKGMTLIKHINIWDR